MGTSYHDSISLVVCGIVYVQRFGVFSLDCYFVHPSLHANHHLHTDFCGESQHLCCAVFAAQTGSSWLLFWHVSKLARLFVQALLPLMPGVV
jgi:hypothetical protein